MHVTTAQIDACLPQTQCTQCNYPSCYDYAVAIQQGAAIDQCPPGAEATLKALAELLGLAALKFNPSNGVNQARQLALIDESACIGCVKCIEACPVDAIIGAAKLMHTVISAECTGCKLCLPVCPIDCIELLPSADSQPLLASLWPELSQPQVERARVRHQQKLNRIQLLKTHRKRAKLQTTRRLLQQDILAAVQRSRAGKSCNPIR